MYLAACIDREECGWSEWRDGPPPLTIDEPEYCPSCSRLLLFWNDLEEIRGSKPDPDDDEE